MKRNYEGLLMKKIAIAVVATAFSGAMVVNGFAASELTKFACAADAVSSSGVIGKIISAQGDVLYSGATGYTSAKPGAELVSGAQVSTGEGASAKISVGSNCDLPIGENSIATVTQKNGTGDVFVSVANQLDVTSDLVQEGSTTQAVGAAAGGAAGGAGTGAGIGAAAGGAAGAGAAAGGIGAAAGGIGGLSAAALGGVAIGGVAVAGTVGVSTTNTDKNEEKQKQNNSDFVEVNGKVVPVS